MADPIHRTFLTALLTIRRDLDALERGHIEAVVAATAKAYTDGWHDRDRLEQEVAAGQADADAITEADMALFTHLNNQPLRVN